MKHLCFFVFLFAAIGVSCTSAQDLPNNGFRFSDDAMNRRFISELRKEGVKFTVDNDGNVVYRTIDERIVVGIRNRFIDQNFHPAVNYEDPEFERRFLRQMDSAQIPYRIEIKSGKRWITWSEDDTPAVDRIREQIWNSK